MINNNSQKYIGFLEAIRIVVRHLPDGGRLADIMTDEWITEGWGKGEWVRPDVYGPLAAWTWYLRPGNEEWLVEFYGPDWEATRSAAKRVYGEATRILRSVLAEGKIAATGHVAGETGRRDIKLDEWSSYYVNLFKDELSNKPGTKLADFPSIASVRVSAEDLRQELLNRGYDSHGPKTARAAKKPAVRKAIRLLGQTNLTPLLGKERVKKIIAKVKDESGLSVSPRLVQTVWSEVRQVRA